MNEIKRWDIFSMDQEVNKNGIWVLHSDHEAEVASLRAEAELAARQPVGEPDEPIFQVKHHDDTEATWRDATEAAYEMQPAALRRIVYAATPAQAVDLGAVRALLQRRIEQWRSHLPADPGAPGTREIETKGEHDYNNDVRIYREGIAVMEEVLFKMDSKAAGNK